MKEYIDKVDEKYYTKVNVRSITFVGGKKETSDESINNAITGAR